MADKLQNMLWACKKEAKVRVHKGRDKIAETDTNDKTQRIWPTLQNFCNLGEGQEGWYIWT